VVKLDCSTEKAEAPAWSSMPTRALSAQLGSASGNTATWIGLPAMSSTTGLSSRTRSWRWPGVQTWGRPKSKASTQASHGTAACSASARVGQVEKPMAAIGSRWRSRAVNAATWSGEVPGPTSTT
jgi:hypothetical protein